MPAAERWDAVRYAASVPAAVLVAQPVVAAVVVSQAAMIALAVNSAFRELSPGPYSVSADVCFAEFPLMVVRFGVHSVGEFVALSVEELTVPGEQSCYGWPAECAHAGPVLQRWTF